MNWRPVSLILSTLLALLVATPAAVLGEAPTTEPSEPGPLPSPAISFTLGPPKDRSIGDWRQIARSPRVDAPRHLSVLGERLVATGLACGPKPVRCRDAGWYSADGMTWTEATLPGDHPAVYDMTTSPDGSMAIAVGAVSDQETYNAGAVWSTRDGIEWTQVASPQVYEFDWVAASDEAIVVSGGDALWVSVEPGAWQQVSGPGGLSLAFGPGGFLAYGGGGQDLVSPSEIWRSPDGLAWTKTKLPKALRRGYDAFGGMQVFALDDGWILIPDEAKLPGAIFTSPDGSEWKRAPRLRGMTMGWIWWIDDLGDDVEAFGWASDLRKQPNGMWTWQPGQKAGKPVLWRKDHIGQPIRWDGQRIALGETSTNQRGTTLWRWEPTAASSEG